MSSDKHEREVQEAHDKGQTDASKGEYHVPHGFIDQLGSFANPLSPPERLTEIKEVNDSYNKGHDHTRSQK